MKKSLLYGAVAIALSMMMGTAAYAQPTERCFCNAGQKCIELTYPDGTISIECSPSIDCDAQFNGNIPGSGPINTTLTPTSITAQVNIPAYGDVDITLNTTRPAGPTTLVSNDANNRFPLTANIRFQADATLQAFPGSLYESTQEFDYGSTNVNSVNPFQGEVFTLLNDVTFQKVAGPATAPDNFEVQAGTSTFTLGDPPPPPPPSQCRCIGGLKCFEIRLPSGAVTLECSPAIECQGDFTGTIPATGVLNASLTATAITAKATVPSLGTVNVALDNTRTSSPTTITSIEQGARFPAEVSINFFATATLDAADLNEYRSTTELTYTGTVNSVNPFNQETLTLANDVVFEIPGSTNRFTLKAGESQIILGP